jgi:ATP-binding cassette, subfamily B, bacterial
LFDVYPARLTLRTTPAWTPVSSPAAGAPVPLKQKLAYAWRVMKIIWAAAGGLLIAWAILLLLQGVIPVAVVWMTKPLVNSVQAAVGSGANWEGLRPLVVIALAYGVLLLVSELLRIALQWISAAQSELVQDYVSDLLHTKASEIDLAFFETPSFYDRLYRVRFDGAGRPLALLESVGGLAQNIVTVIGIGALLLTYGAWVSVVLVAGTLPALLVVLRASRRQHDWWMNTTTDRRRTQYYGDLLTMGQYAAEMRVFGLARYFRDAFMALRRRLRVERLRLMRQQSIARLGAEAVAVLSSAATIAWMVWRAILGAATLGDVALFAQAFQRGQGLVRSLLMNIGQIHSNGLFLENLFEYLDLKPVVVSPADPVPVPQGRANSVRFVDVDFRYPATDRTALRQFNLFIPAGKTVAIVGSNGAGKSTLLKLLCRFYDPENGRVELDGVDLRRFDPAELRKSMTVMFQVPVAYQGTVRDNITLSDLAHATVSADIEGAAREAGVADLIQRLPAGYETPLGKAFAGGTELSSGEWQRIAMARSYFRRSRLIILDEPTSSMDSWSEAMWYERFSNLAQGATAIIITHRLTIARRATEIHVMEGGEIVESGSHDELIALGGRYATSWFQQTQSDPVLPAMMGDASNR